tara:strand:+ start:857 stop:1186 length:330 start_codon:yes stop_codon:yes gene_type:complete
MASRKVRTKRFKVLQDLGFDFVANLYLDLGGVRQLMNELFDPQRGGEKVGTGDFYYWLDKGNHREKWLTVQHQRLKDRFYERKHGDPFMQALIRVEGKARRKKEPLTFE